MRYAARVDLNQAEIVRALRDAGASVELLHRVGSGCPDLLVGYGRRNYLLEVKGGDGRLTPDQKHWHAGWSGAVHVVRSAAEALEVIGAARYAAATPTAIGDVR